MSPEPALAAIGAAHLRMTTGLPNVPAKGGEHAASPSAPQRDQPLQGARLALFATTRWSLIMDARGDARAAQGALGEICRAYRTPVLAYIRRSGSDGADAEDLAQEFFAQLLEHRWDTRADPERGRFRAFLLTALKHFLLNSHAAASAGKRGGGRTRVDFDLAVDTLAAPASQSPEQVFERAWALTVIERSLDRLREEAAQAGKSALFAQLLPYLAEPAEPADYSTLGLALGLRPNTVAVTVHRLRVRLRELVRLELADQTTDGPDGVDRELQVMRAALASGRSDGRAASGHGHLD
jgi:RNA polymerase sigma factor (sigma-70 family)